MNKYIRGLLSGASFAALNFGMFAGTARAGGYTFVGPAAPGHIVTTADHLDFIWVPGDVLVGGNVENDGSLGPSVGAVGAGIEINGAVEGNVINNGGHISVVGPYWGIEVQTSRTGFGAVLGPHLNDGSIINEGGITVHQNGTSAQSGGGIHVTSHAFAPRIHNEGTVLVTGHYGQGIVQQQVGHASSVLAQISNLGGAVTVKDHRTAHGAGSRVATGAVIRTAILQTVHNNDSEGSASAALYNQRLGRSQANINITGQATATGTHTGKAKAWVGGTHSSHPAIHQEARGHKAVAELQNNGELKIEGIAKGKGGGAAEGLAQIVGIAQDASGTASTRHADHAKDVFLNHSSGLVEIKAQASAKVTGSGRTSQVITSTPNFNFHSAVYSTTPGHQTPGPGHVYQPSTGPSASVYSTPYVTHQASSSSHVPGSRVLVSASYTTTTYLPAGTTTRHLGALASAHAVVDRGLVQRLSNAGHLTAKLTNKSSGQLHLSAIATAQHINLTSSGHHAMVLADAQIHEAVLQHASRGQTAKLSISNTSAADFRVHIGAHAFANSGRASAIAWQRQGSSSPGALVAQSAEFVGKASELLANSGNFRITAAATATAENGGRAVARAVGGDALNARHSGGFTTGFDVNDSGGINGILQRATHSVQTANLHLHNQGNLIVKAQAVARSGRTGTAVARIGSGIAQEGHGQGAGHAAGELTNLGELKVYATASAVGASQTANVTATVNRGIRQNLTGDGFYNSALIQNRSSGSRNGQITLSAHAFAGGVSSGAFNPRTVHVHATVNNGIQQAAGTSGTSNYALIGKAMLDNNGALTIKAHATGSASYIAHVQAKVTEGIDQRAYGVNQALASISDPRTLDIYATAKGYAHGQTVSSAHAHIGTGIYQSARGRHSARAMLTVRSGGAVSIRADATGHGDIQSSAYSPAKNANVTADIDAGVKQFASMYSGTSSQVAAVTLHNSGSFHVKAHGIASASSNVNAIAHIGRAVANSSGTFPTGSVNFAIAQSARGSSGQGLAKLFNGGILQIKAGASANGHATENANAFVLGIGQHAQGRTASALITNSNTMEMTGSAHATGQTATAIARIGATAVSHNGTTSSHGNSFTYHTQRRYGISQVAQGFNHALAQLDNNASLKILAKAFAKGQDNASAQANVDGIYQHADRRFGTNATATFVNHDLRVAATASAKLTGSGSGAGHAYAEVSEALFQQVSDASTVKAKLSNTHHFSITAKATAGQTSGSHNADAEARMFRPVWQQARNFKTAVLDIENSGSVSVKILAKATGENAAAFAYQKMRRNNSFRTGLGLINQTAKGFSRSGSSSFQGTSAHEVININSGSLKILARATANASGPHASAVAGAAGGRTALTSNNDRHGLFGIVQSAQNVHYASMAVNNARTIQVSAVAHANSATRSAQAYGLVGAGISQYATQRVSTAKMLVSNLGPKLKVVADARVSGAVTASGQPAASGRAVATIADGINQRATVNHTATLSVVNHGGIFAIAQASAFGAANVQAVATIETGVRQSARANDSQVLRLINAAGATMSAFVSATASGTTVQADANARHLVAQRAYGDGDAQLTVDNSGVLKVSAHASAKSGSGPARAEIGEADGVVISQRATIASGRTGGLSIFNRAAGQIIATDLAVAQGTAADATAWTVGAGQRLSVATSGAGHALLSNAGHITITAKASIQGLVGTRGRVFGHATAVSQRAQRDGSGASSAPAATLTLVNSGNIKVHATAIATAGTPTRVTAKAAGVLQKFDAVNGSAGFNNSGHITVAANARGKGAHATAAGLGVKASGSSFTNFYHTHTSTNVNSGSYRYNYGYSGLAVQVANNGSLKVAATAAGAGIKAKATGIQISAISKTSQFYTRSQFSSLNRTHTATGTGAKPVSGAIANNGNLLVSAKAPGGSAVARGIAVIARTMNAGVHNGAAGVLSALASGKTAKATGLIIKGEGFHQQTQRFHTSTSHNTVTRTVRDFPIVIAGDIVNDGVIKATAKGVGVAQAKGIEVNEFRLSGNLRNNNKITVQATGTKAVASGIHLFGATTKHIERSSHFRTSSSTPSSPAHHFSTVKINRPNGFAGTLENDGSIKVTAKGAGAKANGIVVDISSFTGSIINKGSIAAEADGAGGQAIALQVLDAPALPTGPGTITNSGGTISAKLVNGGVTTWGTAIDVSGAPGVVNIGLSGNGNIYGNVKLKSNSAINVTGPGVTFLSGVINPSKTKAGTITIAAGGNLELANDAAQGNAKAYVTTFTQLGTLSVDIGAVANATPYINAGAATLGGALVVVPGSTLPAATTTYRIVLSDSALTTTWSGVSIKGNPALINATAVYLPNEADISFNLTPIGNLGLTPNQLGTLTPFEQTLAGLLGQNSIDPNSSLGKLVKALFTLTLPQLTGVLDQLGDMDAGAQTENSLSFATALLDQILNHLGAGGATGGVASLPNMPAGVRPAQMTSGAGTIWGGLYGAHASTRSAGGVPGSSTSLTGLYAGYDLALNTDWLAGVAAAYSTDISKTGSPGGHGSANGFQVSPYMRLTRDSGFFANADVSYGIYTNKLSRTVTIPGFGSGTNTGKFNSNVFSAYAEAGHSFANGSLTISPYAALAYARGDSGAYTETGLAGTLLHVNSATAQTLTSYLGAGLAETFALPSGGTITPRMRFAWAHDYSGSAWQVNAAFAALPGSGFAIKGPGLSREKAYINAALDLHFSDEVETSLNYDALFNSDQSQQSLMGVLRFSF